MTDLIAVHNGSHHSKTLAVLKGAAKRATGKARASLQALYEGLRSNPTAARGRRSKEAPSMAKKHKGGTKAVRKTPKTNPTTRRAKRRHSANPGGGGSFQGVNFTALALRGAVIAGGGLAQSFLARQAARLAPSLPGVAHEALSAAVVAGAAVWFGKGKGVWGDLAVGAIATGLTGVAHQFMPGVFAGTEDEQAFLAQQNGLGALGYEDPDQVSGLYDADAFLPANSIRPAEL